MTIITWRNREIVSVPIEKAIAQYRTVDPKDALVKTARQTVIKLSFV